MEKTDSPTMAMTMNITMTMVTMVKIKMKMKNIVMMMMMMMMMMFQEMITGSRSLEGTLSQELMKQEASQSKELFNHMEILTIDPFFRPFLPSFR